MYEDSLYSFVPEFQHRRAPSTTTQPSSGHQRKASLLQPPTTEAAEAEAPQPLAALLEAQEDDANVPPEPSVPRRAKSYSDFHDIVRVQATVHVRKRKQKTRRRRGSGRGWEALAVPESVEAQLPQAEEPEEEEGVEEELLKASQGEYLLYHEELALAERHLTTLINDTDNALRLLESLCTSFATVDEQTGSFRAQCDGLVTEQKRLQALAEDVGRDLQYYTYLDSATRRLNAPGAGRLVDGTSFVEILTTLDSCIEFMTRNSTYRDAESYLARYQSLLTKALHLLEVGFKNHLNKVSAEVGKQIAATQSESARHALAYGRFEELVLESYNLIPNLQHVVRSAYNEAGHPTGLPTADIYANTVNNLFHAYWNVRERDLKPIIQHDLDTFRAEAKESLAAAAHAFIKQAFERAFSEACLFGRIFSIEPAHSTDAKSAFAALKGHQRSIPTGTNIAPIATTLQSALQNAPLETVCDVVGWILHEYLLSDFDPSEEEEETPLAVRSREWAFRLLAEHLWTFTDSLFDAEITKSIIKAPLTPDSLKMGPTTGNDVSSNAFPTVKHALELLVLFDQSMPKERSARNSPVVFRIITETISSLQRAEARIRSVKPHSPTDPDLFMIKNLLLLKNELVTLEIGDIRAAPHQTAVAALADRGVQHFAQIWDTLRRNAPQGGLLGGIWNGIGRVGSTLAPLSGYIPGSSLFGAGQGQAAGAGGQAGAGVAGVGGGSGVQDAHERLDGLLRQHIGAFTKRWAGTLHDARSGRLGGKNLGKVEKELEEMLERAFSGQPEIVAKLREAIAIEMEGIGRERVRRV